MNFRIEFIKFVTSVRFCVLLNARCDICLYFLSSSCLEVIFVDRLKFGLLHHDADAVACDSELSSKLKSAAYAAVRPLSGDDPDNIPVLMSEAGHDAMAMSHLTKVMISNLPMFFNLILELLFMKIEYLYFH